MKLSGLLIVVLHMLSQLDFANILWYLLSALLQDLFWVVFFFPP